MAFDGSPRRQSPGQNRCRLAQVARDGRELFYASAKALMTVEVTTTPAFRASAQRIGIEIHKELRVALNWRDDWERAFPSVAAQ